MHRSQFTTITYPHMNEMKLNSLQVLADIGKVRLNKYMY